MGDRAIPIMVVSGVLALAAAISTTLFHFFLVDRGLINGWPSYRSGRLFWRILIRGTTKDLAAADRRTFDRLRAWAVGSLLAFVAFLAGVLVAGKIIYPLW